MVSFYLVGDEIQNFDCDMRLRKDIDKYYDDLSIFDPQYVVISNITSSKRVYKYIVIARLHKIPVIFHYPTEPTQEVKHNMKKILRKIGIKFFYNFDSTSEILQEYMINNTEIIVPYFVGNLLSKNRDQLLEKKTPNISNYQIKSENSDGFVFRIKKTYKKCIFYGLLYFGTVRVGQKIYLENTEMVVVDLHSKDRENQTFLSGKQLCCIKVQFTIARKKTRDFIISSDLLVPHTDKKWMISVEITRNRSVHITKGFTCHALTKYGPVTAIVLEILSDKTTLYPGDSSHILVKMEKNIYVDPDFKNPHIDRSIIFRDLDIIAFGTIIS